MSDHWQVIKTSSPHLSKPVEVIAAKNVSYRAGGHRLQTFNIYTRKTNLTEQSIGQAFTSIPGLQTTSDKPRWHIHIHGGAWRDPFLTADTVEPLVACAFAAQDSPIDVIIGINYTLSPFPTHSTADYDPTKGDTGQPWREGKHPDPICDALTAFDTLRSFGLLDDNFILSGHSAGACIAFQTVLQDPKHWQLEEKFRSAPRPYAVIGLNGLYDLAALVNGLGRSHNYERKEYEGFLGITFGDDQLEWQSYSPARFDADLSTKRIEEGFAPKRILLDQSTDDQLVPMNQLDRMMTQLEQVSGLHLMRGNRCTGKHADPWKDGQMIWNSILDVLSRSD